MIILFLEKRKIIGQNIRIRRKAEGLSQKELAAKAKISKSTLSAIEHERIDNIGLVALCELANALQVDLISLLSPIASDESYSVALEGLDEEECIEALDATELKKAYYPPLYRNKKFSSILELAIILPLIDLQELFDISWRIMGTSIQYEYYISSQFEASWNHVPDSPAKRFVQKQLDAINAIRNGADYNPIICKRTTAEYNAFKKHIKQKQSLISSLFELIKNGTKISLDKND